MTVANRFKLIGLVLPLHMLAVHIVASELSHPSTRGKQRTFMGQIISQRDLFLADAASSSGMLAHAYCSEAINHMKTEAA